ncbi:MAG: HAD hydrolase-like protein [Bacteroidetes bacterium]|nr:HAD hydrolase-like protein [Bacteroidota bacterium]
MIKLNKYSNVIWDWNGTLLNDAWLCVDVMNGMLKERGLPLKTVAEYRELFDFPVKDYYQKLGYDFEKESFEIVGMEFIDKYNSRHFETTLHPEVPKVLEQFAALGMSQNILSARHQTELIAETRKLDVYRYFERICGLDNHYAHSKKEAGIQLLSDIGALKKRILFIGDTKHDAEVANELGIDCVLITNGHQSEKRLKQLYVPLFNSLQDLIDLL